MHHLRRRSRVRVAGVVAAALGVLALFYGLWWLANESASMLSRRSALVVVRNYLELEAEKLGQYPPCLADVGEIRSFYFDTGLLAPGDLEYVADGKPYGPAGNERLFYETRSRRYGFRVGWFDFYQQEWHFRPGSPEEADGRD